MKYRVEFTDQASAEADEAYTWIAHDSPQNAAEWYYGLIDAIETLTMFPIRCPLAMESKAFGQDIRQLLYGNYRILSSVQDRTVCVLHIRHGTRNCLDSGDTTNKQED